MSKFVHESSDRGGPLESFEGARLQADGNIIAVVNESGEAVAFVNLAAGESIHAAN